jgi:ABC-type branched-subunit amino acid transport system ATPase component
MHARLWRGYQNSLKELNGTTYSRTAGRVEISRDMDRVYATFPKLFERRNQAAATLSGGEQQMCAIRPGLMSAPNLLMIDELSLGLSPLLVEQLVVALRALNAEGMSILLVEQDVTTALDLCPIPQQQRRFHAAAPAQPYPWPALHLAHVRS